MLDLKILHRRNIGFMNCPNCGKQFTIVRYKPDNFKSRLFSYIGFRDCHCRECKWDGRLFAYKFNPEPKKLILNYLIGLIIFIILIYLIRFLLTNIVK